MSSIKAHFDEAKQSQLAAAELLAKLGYRYISRDEALRLRDNDTRRVVLSNLIKEVVKKFNYYELAGVKYAFSDNEIARAIEKLEKISIDDRGPIAASKEKFLMISSAQSGTTVRVSDGSSHDFRFIDYNSIENNDFAFTIEYEVTGKNTIRPDIVIFVNGIPLAVIENKKSAVPIEEAIRDLIKKQSKDYAQDLFIFTQLLIATNVEDFRYGTFGTPFEFYTKWREKEVEKEHGYKEQNQEVRNVLNNSLQEEVFLKIVEDLNGSKFGARIRGADVEPTEQDRGIVSLFKPERFLKFISHYIVYDGLIKKVMRYQQFFAVEKIMKRIKEFEDSPFGRRRRGGVVWHTQGSGKSLTMVNLAKEIIEDPEIRNPRIIIVTDRVELDKQIKDTFSAAGLKKEVHQVKSGKDLIERIKQKDDAILTTLVQKFEAAARTQEDIKPDLDENIFVLIDEAHRSHSGVATQRMDNVIPNACYIAFTGTPLLKNDKTVKRFGSFIDKYTIDDALDDGVVLPLYYEGRSVSITQNEKAIEREASRVTEELSEKDRKELVQGISSREIKSNPNVVAEIAYDVEQHFLTNFSGSGLKAQLVAPSQYAAVKFHEYFEESGKIRTMPIISGTEDDTGDTHKQYVHDYLKKLKERFGSRYEEDSIIDFKENPNGVQILIVVDRLLTGFDAPRNTVLYLAKELRDHNLLQAIARVNRLFDNPNKAYPKTAGYVIDYSYNARNLQLALVLFGNVHNLKDVEHAVFDLQEKIRQLEASHDAVLEMFKEVENKNDSEAYIKMYDGPEKEKERAELYEKINAFLRDFSEAMVYRDFINSFSRFDEFAKDAKKLLDIRRTLAIKNAEKIDFAKYKDRIVRILDKYVTVDKEIERLVSPINIAKMPEVARNELKTDKEKAEAIAAYISKQVTENLEKDPEYFNRVSERVKEIIQRMQEKKLEDAKALQELIELRNSMEERRDDSLPGELQNTHPVVGVLYRNTNDIIKEAGITEPAKVVKRIFERITEKGLFIVDWWMNVETEKAIKREVDDCLFEEFGVKNYAIIKKIQEKIYILLKENKELIYEEK